jgi:hypothetical protein
MDYDEPNSNNNYNKIQIAIVIFIIGFIIYYITKSDESIIAGEYYDNDSGELLFTITTLNSKYLNLTLNGPKLIVVKLDRKKLESGKLYVFSVLDMVPKDEMEILLKDDRKERKRLNARGKTHKPTKLDKLKYTYLITKYIKKSCELSSTILFKTINSSDAEFMKIANKSKLDISVFKKNCNQ